MKRKIFSILFAVVLVVSFSLVTAAPAALAWQEGSGTDWWFIDASYGGWKNSVPLVIKINGNSASGQVFNVDDVVTITSDIHAYAASCAGAHGPPHNQAITKGYLEVNGASGLESIGDSGYHYNQPDCAEVSQGTTLSISYTMTTPGIHTIYVSSSAKVRQYGQDVAEDYVDASLTFEVVAVALDHFLGYKVKTTKVCDGGVTKLTLLNNGPTGDITVTTKDEVVFSDSVATDEEFSFGEEDVKLGTSITITVTGVSETTIHTSCSQPIGPDMVFGPFTVVEGESLRGGPLETPALDFVPREVTLADQFETGLFKVEKPDKLYNPVKKNDEEINDPDTHLFSYKIKRVKGQPKHVKQTNILIKDQFGQLSVDTKKPDRLLVPTAKSLTGPVGLLDETRVDHFKGYKVKISKGTDGFREGIQVFLVDQFNQPKLYDVKKPTRLYVPVDKNGLEIKNPEAHLIGYKIKLAKEQPKHVKVRVYTNNQFGRLKLNTDKEVELLVPCEKILP